MSATGDSLIKGLARVAPSLLTWAWGRLIAGDSPEDLEAMLERAHRDVEEMRAEVDAEVNARFPLPGGAEVD